MELEQFVEEDIKAFLEHHLHNKTEKASAPASPEAIAQEEVGLYSPSKDFERELENAVREGDMDKAQHLLHELKESLDAYPADAPERNSRQHLLEKLYKRFQEAFGHRKDEKAKLLEKELGQFAAPEAKEEAAKEEPAEPKPVKQAPIAEIELSAEELESVEPTSEPATKPKSEPTPEPTPQTSPEATPPAQDTPPISLQPEPAAPLPEITSQEPILPPAHAPPIQAPPKEEVPEQAPAPHGLTEAEEQAFHADIAELETLVQEHAYAAAMRRYREVKDRLVAEELTPHQRRVLLPKFKKIHKSIAELMATRAGFRPSGEAQRFQAHEEAATQAVKAGNKSEAMRQYRKAKELLTHLPPLQHTEETENLRQLHQVIADMPAKVGKSETVIPTNPSFDHGSFDHEPESGRSPQSDSHESFDHEPEAPEQQPGDHESFDHDPLDQEEQHLKGSP